MLMLKKHILFFATLLSFTGLVGQNKSIDSLYKILSLKIHDSTRVNIYNELCWPIYSFSNTDSSIKYGNRELLVGSHYLYMQFRVFCMTQLILTCRDF